MKYLLVNKLTIYSYLVSLTYESLCNPQTQRSIIEMYGGITGVSVVEGLFLLLAETL